MTLTATLAVIRRNLKIGLRRPDLLVQSIAVPVVVLGLASIIFGGADAWPVAVVDKSNSSESQQFVHALEETSGSTGPYFDIVESAPEEARDQVREGRLQLLLEIPEDYAETGSVNALTYNINTDAMKNVRLRVSSAVNLHDAQDDPEQISAVITKAVSEDVSRAAFMGGSAVILAFLLGCTLITANLYAIETEYRTTKEISLTPVGSHLAGLGAAVSGWLLALVTTVPTAVLALAFGTTTTWPDLVKSAGIVVPGGLAMAGVGVVAAAFLRTHQAIQPTVILLAIGSYFASGGFISVAALPPLARDIATWWPVSYIFETANPILHGFTDTFPFTSWLAATVVAALALAAAMWVSRSEADRSQKQGQ